MSDHAPRPSEIAPGFIQAHVYSCEDTDGSGDPTLIDVQSIGCVRPASPGYAWVNDYRLVGTVDAWHRAIAGALEALDRSDVKVRRLARQ